MVQAKHGTKTWYTPTLLETIREKPSISNQQAYGWRKMPRTRRYVESGAVYELCFRARRGLPFVSYQCLNFIIQCVLARVQRDDKVILCHDIWNGSHPHLIVVSKDAKQLVNFYSEIQKKVTDIIKRHLGRDYLEIWEGIPSVIKLGDLDAAMNRIAYLYANPAQDDLEECIERFPGASSWQEYLVCQNSLDDSVSNSYPWLRLPTVPKLSAACISGKEDQKVIDILIKRNEEIYTLTRCPNAWMKCFGVKDLEVNRVNSQIITLLRQKETIAREIRNRDKKSVLGAKRLKSQPIMKTHTPKKKERKIFIITTLKEIRVEFIEKMRSFQMICCDCYQRWKNGEFSVKWPPAAFKPPLPPTISVFAT